MKDRLRRLLAPPQPSEVSRRRGAVAACALLLEVAQSQEPFHNAERSAIETAMRELFQLDEDTIALVLTAADDGSASQDEHATYIRENFSTAQKYSVADAMRAVIWADGVLDDAEARVAARISITLGLPLDAVRHILIEPWSPPPSP